MIIISSNNIAGGVTIDLGRMAAVHYDAAAQTAHIGPGATWINVYNELAEHGRVVAGGRVAEAGVGGLLLGGGNTFYTARHGFACDNVTAYEVVLADGSVVVADARGEHADLFRVLKGGGTNFGIVTRFTLRTFPDGPIWGGMRTTSADKTPQAIQALVDFTTNIPNDPDSSLTLAIGHITRLGGDSVVSICVNTAAVDKPPAFDQLLAIPKEIDTCTTMSLRDVLPYSSLPPGYYNIWFTLCVKNDASIVTKAAELHTALVHDLTAVVTKNEEDAFADFASHCAFQPIPRLFAERSAAATTSTSTPDSGGGGNVLGLEHYAHDALLLQASVSVRTRELADYARPRVRSLVDEVRVFAERHVKDGICPWLHLNYAHGSQAVLQSYGPENVRRIADAAAKYDPERVFQRLWKGGFKISAVQL